MSVERAVGDNVKTAGTHAASTLRSTSGAGFEFEDLVGAWLQIKMLTGELAPAVGGQIIRLQAQVSALGWLIDDLLLTASGRLAISVKGNPQVTSAGLPSDFVKRAWDQWRAVDGPMVRGADALALVTRGAHAAFDASWKEVKDACSGSDVVLAINRIRGNRKQSDIFDSVRQASSTPADATDGETVELIRHLHVLPVDFQLDSSNLASQAIAQCRQLLASSDLTEAEKLWKSLISVASEVRLRRGTVTLIELVSQLRTQFGLRHHPDFASDWNTLSALTVDYKARIQTVLSSGYAIARPDDKAKLVAALKASLAIVLLGESGTGKSALCKSVLDDSFATSTQVWLGPDELRTALSVARRGTLPLKHELSLTLNASKNPNNILVLDSAERIDPADSSVVGSLIQSLMPATAEPTGAPWRIIIITQTQSWGERAETLLRDRQARLVVLEALRKSDVENALLATSSLSWLSSHDETVSALTNLRTLAWVVAAGRALGSNPSGLASPTAIADRLWAYWTESAADIQALTMRLAKREAGFERSFPLTSLDASDAATFGRRPASLPLRLNSRTNHVEFEHDLAADWARFQFLKQIVSDTAQWVALAENPLWTNGLRMLGQFLLRQPVDERTAWDKAFRGAESDGLRLAGDILLDALCLDPEAERFLTERVDLLFADDAKNLARLLRRFRHIGTVPTVGAFSADASLGVYFEARFRSVVLGRWPPVLRFLIAQCDKLGDIASSALAKLCETWLNGTPRELANGVPMPWRKEMTEIVLRMARSIQVDKGSGRMYVMDEATLYTAPLAGASDMPAEVSAWALEMAGRRRIADDVAARISAARRQEAEERAERLKNDPALRRRQNQLRAAPFMVGASRRKLPPWPLGAMRRVDRDFRKACLKDNGLLPLMRTNPIVAAEVLLALLIEDEPEREYGSSSFEVGLGLEFADDSYPAIFWKSPFFQFLQVAPNEALGGLIALVNFCTERWGAETGKGYEGPAPGMTLQMSDGTSKDFVGTFDVFDWTQAISNHNGNLFSALDALERWLVLQLKAGANISPQIDMILREGQSAAFVGLLVNVGKYQPSLLVGPLFPVLSSPLSFYWDDQRVTHIGSKAGGLQFLQAGEAVFELSRSWKLAPHRKTKLLSVVVDLIKADEELAERLKRIIPLWKLPDNPKSRLEFRMIFAALDRANYELKLEPDTNESALTIVWPDDLRRDVEVWTQQNRKPLVYLTIPGQCDEVLRSQSSITDESAAQLYGLLTSCNADVSIEPDVRAGCMLALAATLIVSGETWLEKSPEAKSQVLGIVRAAVIKVGETAHAIRNTRVGVRHERLKFAAYAAMHLWLKEDVARVEWERLVLRLLTSGDAGAEGVVVAVAYAYRKRLGATWWRLLFAGLLWSALVRLAPHSDDDEGRDVVWPRWLARLRRLRLQHNGATADDLNVARVAKGYERLDYARRTRAYESGRNRWRGMPERRSSAGLDGHLLGILFHWLINGSGTGDWNEDSKLVSRLWEHEAAQARSRAKDDGEYALPSRSFGYDLLVKLAALAVSGPPGQARRVWMQVLSHGPAAHYALRHFARGFFLQLSGQCDLSKFEAVWRAMAEYGLEAHWENAKGHWYHGEALLCDLLGFNHEVALQRLPAGSTQRMHDLYKRWAAEHLGYDEESVRRFCHFLTTAFGVPLRLDGLRWIAGQLKNGSRASQWYRDSTSDAIIELLAVAVNENARELAADSVARQGLVEITAELASRNNPTALALQERIRLLR